MKQFALIFSLICFFQTLSNAQTANLPKNGIGIRIGSEGSFLMLQREIKNAYKLRSRIALERSGQSTTLFALGIQKDLITTKNLNLYHGIEAGLNQSNSRLLSEINPGLSMGGHYLLGAEFKPFKQFSLFAETNVVTYTRKTTGVKIRFNFALRSLEHTKIGARINF